MFGSRKADRSGQHPRHRAEHRGEPPPDREHPPHAHADEPARLRVQRRGPQREADLRELEERPEQGDEHEHDGRTCRRPAGRWRRPPICQVSFGNGLGNARISADQIRPASPLKISTSPIVMITTVRTDAFATGAITTRWTPTPSAKAKTSVDGERGPVRPAVVLHQRPGDVGREHRHLALREVDHAGGAVDQHERERERAVDRPVPEPADDLLEEVGHAAQYPR